MIGYWEGGALDTTRSRKVNCCCLSSCVITLKVVGLRQVLLLDTAGLGDTVQQDTLTQIENSRCIMSRSSRPRTLACGCNHPVGDIFDGTLSALSEVKSVSRPARAFAALSHASIRRRPPAWLGSACDLAGPGWIPEAKPHYGLCSSHHVNFSREDGRVTVTRTILLAFLIQETEGLRDQKRSRVDIT